MKVSLIYHTRVILQSLYYTRGWISAVAQSIWLITLSSQVDFLFFTNPSKFIIWAYVIFSQKAFYSEYLFLNDWKSHFSIATPQLNEDINQAVTYLRRMPRTPRFCQGDIYKVSASQSGVHWRHSQGVKLGILNLPNYNNSLIIGWLRCRWP